MGYKKCPRCELNYIPDTEELCDVCKAELKLAPSIYEDESYDDDSVLCPVCKRNYINQEEEMCFQCAEKFKYEQPESALDDEDDEEWRAFLDDEKETPLPDEENIVSLAEIEAEEEENADDDEEFRGDDEAEMARIDEDYDDFDDEDYDDEDEEDDEDEDEEDL